LALEKGRAKRLAYGVVNEYEFLADAALRVHGFDEADVDWLDFVLFNRSQRARPFVDLKKCTNLQTYNIVTGPIADRRLSPEINRLEIALEALAAPEPEEVALLKRLAIKQLGPYRLDYQICLKTQRALDGLKFRRHKNVVRD